ncbi:hypothetical protein ABPH35_07400 [Streptococcus sp. ZJ93]|uniref:hypothetical protein n=1 Tax=Streptococcus handemini TaxID=3161188 RepID=UPI0032EAA3EB
MQYLIFFTISYGFVHYAKKWLNYNAATYAPFSWRYWLSLLAYLYLLLIALLLLVLLASTLKALLGKMEGLCLILAGVYSGLFFLYGKVIALYSKKIIQDTRYYRAMRKKKNDR